jgi:Fe2+ or Zn2+ uptake regulation protein
MEYLTSTSGHPTTDELGRALKDKGISLPPATLYQNLDVLTAHGLLVRFKTQDGQARYDAKLTRHHHLICRSCNRVLDIRLETPLSAMDMRDDMTGTPVDGWRIDDATVELKGICPNCGPDGFKSTSSV